MLLTEHAGKELLAEAAIAVPPGVALESGDAGAATPPFPGPYFLKAQVLGGGRGKAGGVLPVADASALPEAARTLFSRTFGGVRPPFLRLEAAVPHERAFYLSLGVSRQRKGFCLTIGREGGVDVEALAGTEALLVIDVPPSLACPPYAARAAFFHLGLPAEAYAPFETLLSRLFGAVADNGLLLAEINPLAYCAGERFVALDAKVTIDDNVAALRPALARYRDDRFATPAEGRAAEQRLAFVSLPGRVGLVANGAGLAMATMDALEAAGLPAANFLDFGGTADAARLRVAFDLLFADPAVEACCVNMYGGILSCADVAEAMACALDGEDGRPVVVRFAGNAAKAGMERLRAMPGNRVRVAEDMDQAVVMLAEAVDPGKLRPVDALAGVCPTPRAGDAAAGRRGHACPKRPPLPSLLDLGPDSGVLVQGLTGRAGRAHARRMRAYGTPVVAGVTPFRGGGEVDGLPVYDTVAEAVARHDIALSVIFVPAAGAADAIEEAAAAGVARIVCITDGIPQRDMLAVRAALAGRQTTLIGPNTPGLILPGQWFSAGIMPTEPFTPGPVAIFSRSGTLTYEVASRLTAAGIGQALAAGMGGDPFGGAGFVELCEMVRDDARVRAVMVIGEVGGTAEEELAEYVAATQYPKPVAAFVAGVSAPPGRTLGHAGALLERPGGVAAKLACLARAGIPVCGELGEVAGVMAEALCRG
jgi:succinyl-CoA synthetase alpha subunit